MYGVDLETLTLALLGSSHQGLLNVAENFYSHQGISRAAQK